MRVRVRTDVGHAIALALAAAGVLVLGDGGVWIWRLADDRWYALSAAAAQLRDLDHLARRGLADNTIVVFEADHGDMIGSHGLFDKGFMYQEAFRIPLIVRWPGVSKPGAECTEPVITMDIAATLYFGGFREFWFLQNTIFSVDYQWTLGSWQITNWFLGPIYLFLKVVMLLFGMIWVRATWPRIRYDRLMSFGWKVMLPLSLAITFITATGMKDVIVKRHFERMKDGAHEVELPPPQPVATLVRPLDGFGFAVLDAVIPAAMLQAARRRLARELDSTLGKT